jgi:hypothetical protein
MSRTNKRSDWSVGTPSWECLVLICNECRQRKNGPKRLRPKALARSIKSELKTGASKARIVLTTCLRLCPKKATSVAFVAAHGTPRIAAVKTRAQLQSILPLLIDNAM